MARQSVQKTLQPKFTGLTRFIVQQIPGIQTLQLVKTIYFSEYGYLRTFGEALTEVPIIRIAMGPVPANYKQHFTRMGDQDLIMIVRGKGSFRGQRFYFNERKSLNPQFTSIELDVFLPIINHIKSIIASYPYDATELIKNESYQTKPMQRYLQMEQQLGKEKVGGYVLKAPYFVQEDIDSLAEYRRIYRDHLKSAAKYSVEDAEHDLEVLTDLRPFLEATNEHSAREQAI